MHPSRGARGSCAPEARLAGSALTLVVPPQEFPPAAETLLTFLDSVGHRAEADLYLQLFRTLPRESFALTAAESSVLRLAVGALVEQLGFLAQLGLRTPLFVGLFDPSQASDGAARLSRRLRASGIEPVLLDSETPNLAASLRRALRDDLQPVVGFTTGSHAGVAARFRFLGQLASEVGSRKVVLLRRRGALRLRSSTPRGPLDFPASKLDASGTLSVVSLRSDAPLLLQPRRVPRQDQVLLEAVSGMLAAAHDRRLVVNVTSPFDLLKELFTVRGAGTLIKEGTDIEQHASYDGVDLARLRALIDSSFGRRLTPHFFEQPPRTVLLERDYRGAAIVLPGSLPLPYLSKFAVGPIAQGEGMGHDLWQRLCRECPTFYWRTRADNPISPWYAKLCHGLQRDGRWHVFWRGAAPAQIPGIIEAALRAPEDFTLG